MMNLKRSLEGLKSKTNATMGIVTCDFDVVHNEQPNAKLHLCFMTSGFGGKLTGELVTENGTFSFLAEGNEIVPREVDSENFIDYTDEVSSMLQANEDIRTMIEAQAVLEYSAKIREVIAYSTTMISVFNGEDPAESLTKIFGPSK